MSRTYKRFPKDDLIRKPKGRRQALINEARRKSIPPDAYDDLPFDSQCYIPVNAAIHMLEKDIPKRIIIKKLQHKFKLTYLEAEEILDWAEK